MKEPSFALEVLDLDLRTSDLADCARRVKMLLRQYPLLILPAQPLTPMRHVALAYALGPVETHRPKPSQLPEYPEIFRVASRAGAGHDGVGRYWHADGFARATPTRISLYHLVTPSRSGGETLFVDAARAWAVLSPRWRERLANLRWQHMSGQTHRFTRTLANGATVLSVNLGQLCAVDGASDAERSDIIDALDSHLSERCSPLRYQWAEHDVLIVDNHALLHRATTPTHDDLRILDRVSVLA
jgi:alpha-ketoglutarate-dependent taurine dioxygenase